jgi:hypothetical protein
MVLRGADIVFKSFTVATDIIFLKTHLTVDEAHNCGTHRLSCSRVNVSHKSSR